MNGHLKKIKKIFKLEEEAEIKWMRWHCFFLIEPVSVFACESDWRPELRRELLRWGELLFKALSSAGQWWSRRRMNEHTILLFLWIFAWRYSELVDWHTAGYYLLLSIRFGPTEVSWKKERAQENLRRWQIKSAIGNTAKKRDIWEHHQSFVIQKI